MKKEFKMAQVILVYDKLSENRPLTHFAIIYFLWFLISLLYSEYWLGFYVRLNPFYLAQINLTLLSSIEALFLEITY